MICWFSDGVLSLPKGIEELEKENQCLKGSAADLALNKLILKETAKGHFRAPSSGDRAWCMAVSNLG